MANPFADEKYTKGYLADLQNKFSTTGDQKYSNEYQRVYNATAGNFGWNNPVIAGGSNGAKTKNAKDRFKVAQFSYKAPDTMGVQEAMTLARSQLNPLYQQARTNAGAINQQQQALLKQQLNARGQLRGGTANQGAINLSTGLQRTLGDIDTQHNAQVAQLAEQLRQRSQENARQALADAFQRYQAQQGLNMQAQQLNYGVQRDIIGDQRYDEQQAYQRARDSIADEWKQREFDENVRRYGLERAMQEAGLTGMYQGSPTLQKIAADRAYQTDQAQLAISRSNADLNRQQFELAKEKWEAEKNSNPYQISQSATNLAISQALNYATADEAYAALQEYGPAMVEQGVDIDAVFKAINARFKNANPFMFGYPIGP